VNYQKSIGAIALAALLWATVGTVQAFDEAKYPDWKGQWRRGDAGGPRYDPSKPLNAQQAPLTEEYKSVYAASIADQAVGGQGNDPTYTCVPPGMPRIMSIYDPLEIVITPSTTHMFMQHIHDSRRIFTDDRPWPKDFEPTFAGYSIGKWIDTDGDGRYDVLEVETRDLKGPRVYDGLGLPLHQDNKTIIKERIYTDKTSPNIIINEITTIDSALTRPWTATKKYRRVATNDKAIWPESVCAEGNQHVEIAGQNYFLGADGLLMPTRKNQSPPDLNHFK